MKTSDFLKMFMGGKLGTIITLTSTSKDTIAVANANFATARNATTGTIDADFIGCSCGIGSGQYRISRGIVKFNLASIIGTITEANLYIYSGAGNNVVNMSVQQCSNTGTIVADDFDNLGTFFGYGSKVTYNSETQYYKITLNAAGITQLNNKGIQSFICRDYEDDYLNNVPTKASSLATESINNYLELTYI